VTLGWSWFYLSIVLILAVLSRYQPKPIFYATLTLTGWFWVANAIYQPAIVEFETVYAAAIFGAIHTWLFVITRSRLFLWLALGNLCVMVLTLTVIDPYGYKLARNLVFLAQCGGTVSVWILRPSRES
jgi:hypothetical protein